MANTSVMNTGAFSQLLLKDFKKVFFDEYASQAEEFGKVFNVVTMDGAYDRYGQVTGLGSMYKLAEGENVPQESFTQGNEKIIYPEDFGLALAITENMYNDDRVGIMKKGFQELGRSAAYTKELIAWDLLNSGFVSTKRVGIDGQPLFATHNLINGGTYSNVAPAGSAISNTTLQAMFNVFDKMTNEKGVPTPIKPAVLIVAPEKRFIAETYLRSEYNPEQPAGSAPNLINTVGNKGLSFFVSHYLTSSTAWFVLSEKTKHDLNLFIRQPLKLLNWDEPSKRIAVFQATMRCTADFVNWYGTYGNSGA